MYLATYGLVWFCSGFQCSLRRGRSLATFYHTHEEEVVFQPARVADVNTHNFESQADPHNLGLSGAIEAPQ